MSNQRGEYVLSHLARLEQHMRTMGSQALAAAGTERKLGRHSHAFYHQGRADARMADAALVAQAYDAVRRAYGLS